MMFFFEVLLMLIIYDKLIVNIVINVWLVEMEEINNNKIIFNVLVMLVGFDVSSIIDVKNL